MLGPCGQTMRAAAPSTTAPPTHNNAAPTSEVVAAARKLRLALDDLMETTFVNTPDKIAEVKLEQFLMLVSQYDDDAIRLCPQTTKPQLDLKQQQEGQGGRSTSSDGGTSSSWYTGRLPIHLACDKSAAIDVIKWLLDNDKTKHTIRIPDKWGDLPLHTVCRRSGIEKQQLDVVKLLLEADDIVVTQQQTQQKQQLHQKKPNDYDDNGNGNNTREGG